MLLLVYLLLLVSVVILALRLHTLHRALDEMGLDLEDRLQTDTNVLLSLSTRDRHARQLAVILNRQLRALRAERRRYQSGDRELRDAVTSISHRGGTAL